MQREALERIDQGETAERAVLELAKLYKLSMAQMDLLYLAVTSMGHKL